MNGRVGWIDNATVERLWRSLKYDCVYPNAFETSSKLHTGLSLWIGYYNQDRHQSRFGGRTPDEVYG